MARQQPINADVPVKGASEGAESKPAAPRSGSSAGKRSAAPRKTRRRGIPAALKGIAGLVVLAIVFFAAAILGGRSSDEQAPNTPAPVSGAATRTAEPDSAPAAELGYPAFATSNTTRVGGPDPASNAAGVALAVYPSTDEAQRPAAIALVDADDWRGALAASVLMAQPLGAPLLIAEGGELPEPTEQALGALDPQGSEDSVGAAAIAIGAAPTPDGLATRRIAAASPATQAAAIARLREEISGRPPEHFVIAPSDEAAIAMPAAAWAARSGDPVLFAGRDELPGPSAALLRQHRGVPVYVLGPSSAISSSVVREIAKTSKQVRRASGEDPVQNAIAFARYSDGDFGWNVNDPGHGFVVARSDAPLAAAAAAPLSASGTWGPLLLTDSADTLPAALRGYLLDIKPGYTTNPTRAFYNHVWVIGDEEAIDVSQQAEIDELAELAKIGGAR